MGFLLLTLILSGCTPNDPPPPPVGADGNIVVNADFEGGSGMPPTGWMLEQRVAHKGSAELLPRQVSGQCLRLKPNDKNGEGVHPLAVGQGFSIQSFKGKQVRLAGRLGAEGKATAVLGLYAIRSDGNIVDGVRLTATVDSPAMVIQEGLLSIPVDSEAILLILSCAADGKSGAVLFDDVFVGAVSQTKTETASSRIVVPNIGHATVVIDTTQRIRTIPSTLYGTNIEWIYDGYGLWNRKQAKLNTRVVDLTRSLGTSLLRFPGGVFSDFYHWRDGIGPMSKRRSSPHVPGGPTSQHLFGTDEAIALARATGTRLMITVNAGTGTPKEAADWIRYVSGKGAKDRVALWEVGNELYGRGDVAEKVTLTPAKYAEQFLAFAKAMRRADKDIVIGAIGGENYGLYQMNGYSGWNSILLKRAAGEIDFLSLHNAYAPMVFQDRGDDVRTVYQAMLAAPLLIAENLETVSRQIDELGGDRANTIKIAVTEWGPWFAADPKSRLLDHVKTMGSALFVADVLKVFIESPKTCYANAFKLVDNAYLGWIGLREGRHIPKAPYYAMQMFTNYFGSVLVESKTTGPTYNSTAVGLVGRVQDVPYLDVVVSVSEDDQTLFIMGINKNFDRSVKAKISLGTFDPSHVAESFTLNGPGIDAHTGTQLPEIPGLKWGRQATALPKPSFDLPDGGNVRIRTVKTQVAQSFEYTFPAHSVTSLRIRRAK